MLYFQKLQEGRYDLGSQLCECLVGFEDVWNNLFSNAIKSTDEGGKVILTLKCEGGKAVVKVAGKGR